MVRSMERLRITPEMVAERLGVAVSEVRVMLERPRRAPLIMLDGEDAQSLREDVAAAGLQAAVRVLREASWGNTLRFYRPLGLNLPKAAPRLISVLYQAGERREPADYPLDGVIYPKVERVQEVDCLIGMLDDIEGALRLEPGRLRVGLLIESGSAVSRLGMLVDRSLPRLSALIFGLVDYSADLGLATVSNRHPVADWARAEIVNAAGAAGVPAIDAMTIDYPVTDPRLSPQANQERFLDRIELVYRDAVHAREMGMTGKWVGHPAQLFAVLLAFEAWMREANLEREAQKLLSYRRADEEGRGATIIDGVMSDRATDRHARELLRRGVATGHFDPDRALELGVIAADELDEARRLRRD